MIQTALKKLQNHILFFFFFALGSIVILIGGLLLHRNSASRITSIRSFVKAGNLKTSATVLDRQMVPIPEGEFIMGSNDGELNERPCRLIYLDAFMLDKFEVTNIQYKRFIDATNKNPPRYWTNRDFPKGQPYFPVVGVSWDDALAYCKSVGKRLPTEAEWEKACRGTDGRTYPWGNDWNPRLANVGLNQVDKWPITFDSAWQLLQMTEADSGFPSLQPIGSFPNSGSLYGIFDLVGNASEWVADWYNWNGYWDLPLVNPVGLGPSWNRSLRGSGWFDRLGQEDQVSYLSRCSTRNSSHSYDDPRLGFRCAR